MKIPIFILTGWMTLAAHVSAATSLTLYVATDGNDSWTGRRPKSGFFFRREGPFATVTRALAVAREARRQSKEPLAVTIELQKGTYYLSEPLVLRPEDSGLTISGDATLSGGLLITNWWAGSINGRTCLMANAPRNRNFHQLWVQGRRATLARQPNKGYFYIESAADATASWMQGQSRFIYESEDLPAYSKIDPGAQLVIMTRWAESHLPIVSVDPAQRLITCSKKSVYQVQPHDPYYIEGIMDALDATGEWFLDRAQQTVYYLPREGEAPENVRVVAPVLSQLLRVEGDPAASKFVSNLTLKGITFSHTEWQYPRATVKEGEMETGGMVQAAFTVPGAVYAKGLRNSTIDNCKFKSLGGYGLELAAGCRQVRVGHCEFSDLGAGGLKVGEPEIREGEEHTSGIQLASSVITNGGKIFHSAVGIWMGQSSGNTILSNEIGDFYYTGISIGWTWGYGPSAASNNIVMYNHVHHIGRKSDDDGPILSDMGGIYTLGMQPGTRIINNLWHDIFGLRYGGWGIYFDEGSSSILAASNVVYNTTHGGFHQHYGATNMVWNNVFAFSRDQQLARTRPEPHVSFSMRTNIVYIDQGVFLGGDWQHGLEDTGWNLFFDSRPGGETNRDFQGMTLPEWQARGHETNSVFADPGFLDPEHHDFTLSSDSPARKLGFQQILLPK